MSHTTLGWVFVPRLSAMGSLPAPLSSSPGCSPHPLGIPGSSQSCPLCPSALSFPQEHWEEDRPHTCCQPALAAPLSLCALPWIPTELKRKDNGVGRRPELLPCSSALSPAPAQRPNSIGHTGPKCCPQGPLATLPLPSQPCRDTPEAAAPCPVAQPEMWHPEMSLCSHTSIKG